MTWKHSIVVAVCLVWLMTGALSWAETQCIEVQHQPFLLEVAKTPEEQRQGLQFRKSLPANSGMMFVFPYPQVLNFWMRDCLIPLDILFFRDGKVVTMIANAPPCTAAQAVQCPLYSSEIMADTAIELPAGSIARYRWNQDTRIRPCINRARQR